MNRKIPFHDLASLLAANCNITPEEAEDFIKNFFDLIARTLVSGESVKIKGIGSFAPTGDTENPIEFTPDASIADTINAPFALFEAEEVSDTLTDAEFAEIDDAYNESSEANDVTVISEAEPASEPESVSEPETVTEAEPVSEPETEVEVETDPVQEPEAEIEVEPCPAPDTATVTETDAVLECKTQDEAETPVETVEDIIHPSTPVNVESVQTSEPAFPEEEPEEYITEPRQKSSGGFGMGFLLGIIVGLALGACAVYFAIDYIFPTSANLTDSSEDSVIEADPLADILMEPTDTVAIPADTQSADTITAPVEGSAEETPKTEEPKAEQPVVASMQDTPQPTNKTVKDTIKKGYLLNDMAKKHFGNKCFWVYIYEENKAKISNPNRVSPGLELVIPDASKYGIDASSQASINAANEKAGKILAKYPR